MEPTEATSTSALTASADDLSPLEQDVLDEYERLAENMKKVCLSRPISGPERGLEQEQAVLIVCVDS